MESRTGTTPPRLTSWYVSLGLVLLVLGKGGGRIVHCNWPWVPCHGEHLVFVSHAGDLYSSGLTETRRMCVCVCVCVCACACVRVCVRACVTKLLKSGDQFDQLCNLTDGAILCLRIFVLSSAAPTSLPDT